MGVRFPSVGSASVIVASVGINSETTLQVTPLITLPLDSALVFIVWSVVHTVGTTAVSTSVRIRRGNSASAPLLNAGASVTATAGNTVSLSGCWVDAPGAAGPIQYSIGVIDPASTVAGAVQEVSIFAFAL